MRHNNDTQVEGRFVTDIILMVLEIIPDSETRLKQRLLSYYEKLSYNMAPELLKSAYTWKPFIDMLNKYIPHNHDDPWKQEIYNILMGSQQK